MGSWPRRAGWEGWGHVSGDKAPRVRWAEIKSPLFTAWAEGATAEGSEPQIV